MHHQGVGFEVHAHAGGSHTPVQQAVVLGFTHTGSCGSTGVSRQSMGHRRSQTLFRGSGLTEPTGRGDIIDGVEVDVAIRGACFWFSSAPLTHRIVGQTHRASPSGRTAWAGQSPRSIRIGFAKSAGEVSIGRYCKHHIEVSLTDVRVPDVGLLPGDRAGQPSPGPRPKPGRRPSGSSCQVMTQPAPGAQSTAGRLASAYRRSAARPSARHMIVSISAVVGSSPGSNLPRTVHTQEKGISPTSGKPAAV